MTEPDPDDITNGGVPMIDSDTEFQSPAASRPVIDDPLQRVMVYEIDQTKSENISGGPTPPSEKRVY